jgi:dipeptidyl aminopeptidase/acylaminoacyl peptidase
LKAQGVPTELNMAPNEGHQWVQPVHELTKMNLEMEWIERHTRQVVFTPELTPAP